VKAGETYILAFHASADGLEGCQGTLAFDARKLELVSLIEGAAERKDFGLSRSSEGLLALSWIGAVEAGQPLFSLAFRALADGRLSDWLSMGHQLLRAEAYTGQDEPVQLALQFSASAPAVGFELLQNIPNPFQGVTAIGFYLPEPGPAVITIVDITGKLFKQLRLDGTAGYNQVLLHRRELPAAGLLVYTVEAAGFRASRKMLALE